MTSLYDISEMLKQARGDAKLSQEALASRAGVLRTMVGRLDELIRCFGAFKLLPNISPCIVNLNCFNYLPEETSSSSSYNSFLVRPGRSYHCP